MTRFCVYQGGTMKAISFYPDSRFNDDFRFHEVGSRQNREETITGILNPISWDKYGRVKKFSISSNGDEDIIIEGGANYQKLKSLINRNVIAWGKTWRSDEEGGKRIKLRHIEEVSFPSSSENWGNETFENDMWSDEYSVIIPDEYVSA